MILVDFCGNIPWFWLIFCNPDPFHEMDPDWLTEMNFLNSYDIDVGPSCSPFPSPEITSSFGKRLAGNLQRTAVALDRIQSDIGKGCRKKKGLFLVARPLRPLAPPPFRLNGHRNFFPYIKKVIFS